MQKKNSTSYLISKAPISKTIAFLVIPALLGSVVGQINFILDTFFLAKADYASTEVLLAAVAVAFPISLIILAFANLFGIGGAIYGAKTLGTGDKLKARSIFSGTVVVSLILNVLLTILLLIFLPNLLTILGANTPEVLIYATDYARIMIMGSFTVMLTFIFVMFARSEGKAMLVLVTIVLQTILNIILNYIFVLPLEMGTFGASLATVISQGTQFLIIGIFLFSSKSEFQFTSKFRNKFNSKDVKEIISLGVPATLGIVLLTVSAGVLQFQAGQYNDTELTAAIGVLIKFLTMFTMLIQAASSGIQPVFAFSFGSKNKERFLDVATSYFKVSTIVVTIGGALLVIFPKTFASFLSLEGEMAYLVAIGTIGIGLMIIFMSASFLMQVLYQSIGRAKIAMIIVLIRQLFIFLIFTITLNNLIGMEGLLVSQQLGTAVGGIITVIVFYKPLRREIENEFAM